MRHTRNNADYRRKAEVAQKGELLIEIPKDGRMRRNLISNGVKSQTFNIVPFVLERHVSNFVSEVEGLKPKSVSKQKQLDSIKKVIDAPLKNEYTCCISSRPNDLKAKLLGTYIMCRALDVYNSRSKLDEKIQKKLNQKSPPLFYNVMGWSKNELFERKADPALIVFSNVPSNMTPHKLEKLRDLMEMYSGIPRIVVTTGHDPVTFFNTHLMMGLNYCCYLTDSGVKKVHEV